MTSPLISVVIATFNSEKTLEMALESLKKQTYPKRITEVLIVDGGSSDATLKIARDFGCKIINNPQTEPVYGKLLGYRKAKGKYVMYLDSDEVLENKKSIELKIDVFSMNRKVKAVVPSGYKSPNNYPFINHYINEFGDPFSFFIYRLSKDFRFFLPTMKARYEIVSENKESIIFDLSNVESLPLIELVAGGSMFDAEYLKGAFPQTLEKKELLPHYFYLMASKYPYLALIKNDTLTHYSADILKKYFTKIRWRVKNNIYFTTSMGASGFSGRQAHLSFWKRLKKFLFVPYAFSVVFPILDSTYLALTRKNLGYFLHTPLALYTSTLIIYHSLLKILGSKPVLKSYDESKVVGN